MLPFKIFSTLHGSGEYECFEAAFNNWNSFFLFRDVNQLLVYFSRWIWSSLTVGRYFVFFVVEIVLVGDPLATTEKGKSTPSPHTYFCPVLAHKPLTVIRRGHMTTSSWKISMVLYEAISSFPDFSNPTYEALHVCYWLFGSKLLLKIWSVKKAGCFDIKASSLLA